MATEKKVEVQNENVYDYRTSLFIPMIVSALIVVVAAFFWSHGLITAEKLNADLVWAAVLVAVVLGVFMGSVLAALQIIRKMQ